MVEPFGALTSMIADRAVDRIVGAVPCTQGTAAALVRINMVGEKSLTYTGRTSLLYHMSLVFFAEIAEGGQYRVGGSLAQTTGRVLLNVVAEFLQLV